MVRIRYEENEAVPRKTRYEEALEYAKSYVPIQIVPRNQEWIPIEIIEEPKSEELIIKPSPFEPRNFNEFIGQEVAKDVLKIIVDSANKEQRLIPNILLTGAYGHGKTTLAKLIAKRHKKKVKIIDGSIAGTIIVPSKDTVYIVDEAHNIPAQLADTYNLLIDSNNLRIIACTTKPGALSAPFRSRFRSIYLVNYTEENIKAIVQKAANRIGIKISSKTAQLIASRSKLNPRYALSLLDFLREIATLSVERDIIKEENVASGLAKLGVDPVGLTELDRKYLKLLKSDRPVGLQYIASVLSLDVDTIQEEIEPYLIQMGLVERTPRGRIEGNSFSMSKILEGAKNYTP